MSSGLDKTIRRFTDQLVRPKPNSILYNRFVLYFVFFIALSNLFLSVFQQDYLFCVYFILIGFILTFFHKNMTVVLVLTVAIANILRLTSRNGREGLEDMEKTKEGLKEGADETLKFSEVDEKSKPSESKPSEKSSGKGGDKSKSEMVDDLKKDAEKLIDTQHKIIGGFEKIDPYMKQAEQLIEHIDTTAKKIESINKSKIEQYRNSN